MVAVCGANCGLDVDEEVGAHGGANITHEEPGGERHKVVTLHHVVVHMPCCGCIDGAVRPQHLLEGGYRRM